MSSDPSGGTASASTPAPCSAPEHRQFDFWLGDWEVRDPAGEIVGTNRVVQLQDGCVIQENWLGTSGVTGTSYNAFHAPSRRWHQTWVDNQGSLLLLTGGLEGDAMVLGGTTSTRDDPGATVHHRITWRLVDGDPDRVRQHWQASTDDGTTWRTVFDGRYVRIS